MGNCEAEPQCINFINEMLAWLSQKVQREAEECSVTMVTYSDGEYPRDNGPQKTIRKLFSGDLLLFTQPLKE